MRTCTRILACILGLLNCWCVPVTLFVLVAWIRQLVPGESFWLSHNALYVLALALLVILGIHAVRLVMFYDAARRAQIALLLSMPVIRILGMPVYYFANRPIEVGRCVLPLAAFVVSVSFDVGIALLLHSQAVRKVYAGAEERRRMKLEGVPCVVQE